MSRTLRALLVLWSIGCTAAPIYAETTPAPVRTDVEVKYLSWKKVASRFLPGTERVPTNPAVPYPGGVYPPVAEVVQEHRAQGTLHLLSKSQLPSEWQDWEKKFLAHVKQGDAEVPVIALLMEGAGHGIQYAGNPQHGAPRVTPDELAAFLAPRIREAFLAGSPAVEVVNFACLADYGTGLFRPFNELVSKKLLELLDPELKQGLKIALYGPVGEVDERGEVSYHQLWERGDAFLGEADRAGLWRVRHLAIRREGSGNLVGRVLSKCFSPLRAIGRWLNPE